VKRTSISLIGIFSLLLIGCAGSVGNSPPTPQAALSVSPSSASVRGTGTQQFTATAKDGSMPALAWAVNGVAGGNASTGTISATGLFTAPEFPPSQNAVTITATETADSTKTATAAVTLQNPVPQLTSVTPTTIDIGTFSLTLNGAHFATGASVLFGSTALSTTRVSSTQLTATGMASSSQTGNITITVQNPAPGTISSGGLVAQVIKDSGITVQVSPASTSVRIDSAGNFTATVMGSTNQSVTWSVNGIPGGNGSIGTIAPSGHYSPPPVIPSPNTVTVTATSVADNSKQGNSSVALENPIPGLTAVNPNSIGVGAFMITVTGFKFVNGASVLFGGQPLTTMFVSSTELTAIGTATAAQAGNVSVAVQNPNPGQASSGALMAQVINGGAGLASASVVRFLEQSTFGPTPTLVNQVQQTGFDTFLQGQLSAPVSVYPTPAPTDTSLTNVQNTFFKNAVNDNDQLRQRLAFALNEIWVVGENKVSDPTGYTNYMQALNNDALGNYYNVMKDITLTAAMGHWLDMVDNVKPATGQHANENYARELMQLFTLGLSQTNPDGSQILDGSGNPIPTYTQADVMALGRSFTGWTYPTEPGMTLQAHNPSYYGGPMVVGSEANHDSGAKTFLGQPVPAGQSAEQELDTVLTIIFNNSNMPPFVCQQLIEKLVTSNPSPAYVQRVSQAFTSGKFNSYGSGNRGDMQAVAAAILLDPEARRGDLGATTNPNDGKLREPVVMEVSIARAFNATTDGTGFTNWSGNMSQSLFNSGSVFNFFPPQSLIPQTTLNGPEFAIFNTNTSLARVNFINTMVYSQISGTTTLDFTPVINAGTPDQMVAWLNTYFLHGTLSDPANQSLITAINAVSPTTDTKNQARTAIYLVASSSQYQVQR